MHLGRTKGFSQSETPVSTASGKVAAVVSQKRRERVFEISLPRRTKGFSQNETPVSTASGKVAAVVSQKRRERVFEISLPRRTIYLVKVLMYLYKYQDI